MATLKRCSKCDEEKPATAEFFSRAKKARDGLQRWCKVCERDYRVANKERKTELSHAWYLANKEHHAEWRRLWRLNPANKELESARESEWRLKNKERVLEREREWRAKNKGRIAEQNHRWSIANKETNNARNHRRRARRRGAEGTHTAADIQAQYKRQKGRCYWCGIKLNDDYHVDHIVPLARGGSNDKDNLVLACPFCNKSKGAKLPHEWPQGNRLI